MRCWAELQKAKGQYSSGIPWIDSGRSREGRSSIARRREVVGSFSRRSIEGSDKDGTSTELRRAAGCNPRLTGPGFPWHHEIQSVPHGLWRGFCLESAQLAARDFSAHRYKYQSSWAGVRLGAGFLGKVPPCNRIGASKSVGD